LLVERYIRATNTVIGRSRWIFSDQRHGLSSTGIGLRTILHEHLMGPTSDTVDDAVEAVVLFCIFVTCDIPIFICQQSIPERTHSAQGQRKSIAPCWITRRGGVSQERDSLSVGMPNPRTCRFKTRERPSRFHITVILGRHTGSDAFLNEARDVRLALQSETGIDRIRKISSNASTSLREEERALTQCRVVEDIRSVVWYPH